MSFSWYMCSCLDISPQSGYSHGKCKCSRCTKGNRDRMRRASSKRLKVLRRYKLWKGCKLCGYKCHHAALTFDHINPASKKFAITHGIGTRSWKVIKEEVRKCEVLCFNCHMIKTQELGEGNTSRRWG